MKIVTVAVSREENQFFFVLNNMPRVVSAAEIGRLSQESADLARKTVSGTAGELRAPTVDLARRIDALMPRNYAAGLGSGVPGVLVVQTIPPADSENLWREIEGVAWETLVAADRPGQQALTRCAIVRAVGTSDLPPLPLEERALRILVIACEPEGDAIRLDVEGAVSGLRSAFVDRLIQPEFVLIRGPRTREQLRAKVESGQIFDIIHIIAHGSRKERTILTEGVALPGKQRGGALYMKYTAFAQELAGFWRPETGPRLVTLNVCESSPLALEIMNACNGMTRVVGLLYEGLEGTSQAFFADLYRSLFDSSVRDGATSPVHVERGLVDAVEKLRLDGKPQWFLPVLYGPPAPKPLLEPDHDPERGLQRAARSVVDALECGGPLDTAYRYLGDMASDPREHVRKAIDQFRHHVEDVQDLQREVGELRASFVPGAEWSALYAHWSQRPPRRRVASAEGVPLSIDLAALQDVAVLRAHVRHLTETLQSGIEALRSLAEYRRGAHAQLVSACNRLRKVFAEDASPEQPTRILRDEALRTLDSVALETPEEQERRIEGLEALLGQYRSLSDSNPPELADLETELNSRRESIRVASRSQEAAKQTIRGAEQALARAESASSAAQRAAAIEEAFSACAAIEELPPAALDAGGSRAAFQACLDRGSALLRGMPPSADPPAAHLEPGHRVELVLWIRHASAGTPAREAAPTLPRSARELLDVVRRLRKSLDAGVTSRLQDLAARCPSVLLNDGAPLRLAGSLSEGLHPYACWRHLGIGFSSTSRSVVDQAGWELDDRDAERADILHHAFIQLKEAGRRLCADILLLPCADEGRLDGAFQKAVVALFRGEVPPEALFRGLDEMDRDSLLAALGRTSEAADNCWSRALANPGSAEILRHALLVTVHHACTEAAAEAFTSGIRHAFALYGLLVGSRGLLAEWIRSRYAIYPEVVPADLAPLIASVTQPLEQLIEQAIQARGTSIDSARLRAEWRAEVSGATEAGRVRGFPCSGGYWAVRSQKKLDALGLFLCQVYKHMATLSQEELAKYVIAVDLAPRAWERLVCLFSDFRCEAVDPGPGKSAPVEGLFADDFRDPQAQMEAAEQFLAQPDARDRFPMHVRLPVDERAGVLLATVAAVSVRRTIDRLREALLLLPPIRQAIYAQIEALQKQSQILQHVNYAFAEHYNSAAQEAGELLVEWTMRVAVLSAAKKVEPGSQPPQMADLDQTARVADYIFSQCTSHSIPTKRLGETLAELHCQLAIRYAEELQEPEAALRNMRAARRHDSDSPRILLNLLRAGLLHALSRESDASQPRERILDGLRQLREDAQRTPHLCDDKDVATEVRRLDERIAELEQPQQGRIVRVDPSTEARRFP